MDFLKRITGPSEEEAWRQFADEIGGEFLKGGFLGTPKVLVSIREWAIAVDAKVVTKGGGERGPGTTVHYTRMTTPFTNRDGFRFMASPKSLLRGLNIGLFGLGKHFGMQDIETGYPEISRNFVIKGNSESKVRSLFANERIRQLMQSEPSVLLQVQHPWRLLGGRLPKGVDELYLEVPSSMTEGVDDLYVQTSTGPTRLDPRDVGRIPSVDWQTEQEFRHLTTVEGRKSLAVERLKTLYDLFTETLNQLWHIGSASNVLL